MNKQDLIGKVAEITGMAKGDSEKAVNAVFDQITEQLKARSEVRLVGFGTFKTSVRKASQGRNPRKQISVSRTFASFEELWNITLKSPALQPVLNRINKHDLSELKQNVKSSLVVNENQSVTYAAHANAIKGTV
jgi:DNA-binding protein HU-beta